MAYAPTPIDASQVHLSPGLAQLIERLAGNNHDLWAKRRMAEGWQYGPCHDDANRQTPLLVPFDELPEADKQSDRDNAAETLKTIISLGWTIEDPGQRSADPVPRREEYQKRAKQANAEGEAIRACDIASEGLKHWPGDLQLRQMQALGLARIGSREKSQGVLDDLVAEGHQDEETLGLIARTYKDIWLRSGITTDLDRAYNAYLRGFQAAPASYWLGINAATLAFARGDGQTARTLAGRVRAICNELREGAPDDNLYWLTATSAEACLLLELLPEAEALYAETGKLGRERFGDILSTWGNARLILSFMDTSVADRIDRALNVPRVAVFAGHRVDEPGSAPPRFPESRTGEIRERIKSRLVETRARLGYSSAASGADILFLEAMQAIGGRTYIVLPCNEVQFVEESVATSGADWVDRFKAVRDKANEVIVSSRERLNLGSVAYDFSNELLYGLANLRARQFGTDLVHLAVWDGREPGRRGGTADIVERWRQQTSDIIVIRPLDTDSLEGRNSTEPTSAGDRQDDASLPGFSSEFRAMLFADAYHFSHLSEAQIPFFVRNFMGSIAMMVNQTRPRPLFQNTWGDGLYMVFSTVVEAGWFAVNLARRVAAIDRKASNLPLDMTLRISLHAGPVYRYKDQIIDKTNYIGSHVNRAARIEPITPPGQIYATDAFAALAELYGPSQFRFNYVGRTALAKGFGEFPMYDMQPGA